MIKACDLNEGDIVVLNSAPNIAETIQVQTPSARGASTLYKVRFRNLQTKQKTDKVFKGDDPIDTTDFDTRKVQFLYNDGHQCMFMDMEDYSQFGLISATLKEELQYLVDGMEGIKALVADERILGIELPAVVELKIKDTGPALKGASVTSRTKTAVLETGLSVQVPEYMETGTLIRVDTRTGEFASRA